jgi:hypothetical protein
VTNIESSVAVLPFTNMSGDPEQEFVAGFNRGNIMKLVTNERMKSENLKSGELIGPNEHADFWHHEIVDSTGQVFIGVVYENGAVETGYRMWDSVDTFERFQVARPILNHYSEYVTRTLYWNQDANELFCKESPDNSSHTYIHQVAGSEILHLLLSSTEDDLIELPQTEHICVSLPAQLGDQILEVATAENQSFNDWVVSRLSESVEDERSRASLAQAAVREKKQLGELVQRLKDNRAVLAGN